MEVYVLMQQSEVPTDIFVNKATRTKRDLRLRSRY